MPCEPEESNFKSKIRARAYPCVERNNLVWTYMGPREVPPPLPDIEPNLMATEEVVIQKALRDCNWFQGLEGDIDTSHLGFLHLGAVKPEDTKPGSFDYYLVKDRAPRYAVVDTEIGTSYGCYRPAEPETYYWRVAHFLFPFYTMSPTGIAGIHQQDQAITESMGPIYDRTQEHLGTSDAMVIRTRRRAINAAKALRDTGDVPPGVDDPKLYRCRSGGVILPRAADWLDATKELRQVFVGDERADAAAP